MTALHLGNYSAELTSSLPSVGFPRTYHIYGYGPLDELARYDLVVGTSFFDVAGLRSRNPNIILLLHPGLSYPGPGGVKTLIHVSAPGAAGATWPGGTDSQTGNSSLGSIRATNPAKDLLHNADGTLSTIGTTIKGWNLTNPGTPELVYELISYAAKADGLYVKGWDGLHSDNWIFSSIGASWFYGPNIDADGNGVADDIGVLRQKWSDGLVRVGTLLSEYFPNMVIGGNGQWYQSGLWAGTDPQGWLKSSNYTLIESVQKFPAKDTLAVAKQWLGFSPNRYLAALAYATDFSGNLITIPGDPNSPVNLLNPDVLRSMRWGLTLSLMCGMYYELTAKCSNPMTVRWWFDEYDGGLDVQKRNYLGEPYGPYQELATGFYRRDFENGVAINNSSGVVQSLCLGGNYKKIRGTQNPVNDGSRVTNVTIPPSDGMILLRA